MTPDRTDAIVVPSHARAAAANTKTLRLLADRGVPADLVHVIVDPGEMLTYRGNLDPGLYGTLLPGGDSLTEQRMAGWRHFPEGARLVSVDDDLTDFRARTGEKELSPIDDAMAVFARGWRACDEAGATLWGIYPVFNAFFMRAGHTTDLRFCIGHLFGTINRQAAWALPTMDCKEDYERTLQRFEHDGTVVRLNDVAAKTRINAPGGIAARGDVEHRNRSDVAALLGRYPERVRIQKRRGTRGLEIALRNVPARSRSVVNVPRPR